MNQTKKNKDDPPHLTSTEKSVLKELMKNARASDTAIAKATGVTPPAVLKIRRKLEASGFILAYYPLLNFDKLGAKIFAIHFLKLLPRAWESAGEEEIQARLKMVPNVIFACRVMDPEVSYICISAFPTLSNLTTLMLNLESNFSDYFKFTRMVVFSSDNILKIEQSQLISNIMDEAEPELPLPWNKAKRHSQRNNSKLSVHQDQML